MDPRQPPQQPFSRNTASPYGRTPFHPTSNQAPFAPTSHPPPAAPSYAEHNRRPSDPPYYNNTQRSYGSEGPPMSGPGHARHQSASSIGHGTPVNRNMPPPSSPQQQQASQQNPQHHYGPPPPRPPPVSVGPPNSFPSRELPSLPPLGRPASNNGMSISSILGGPSPAAREASSSHYASPVTTSAPPPPPPSASSLFGQSPRMASTPQDYAPFRRPQTPEHQRPYEPRDARANSAGSPPNMGHYSTPEARRFGTPQQGYAQRVPVEERREPARVPNPNVIPQRPNSQPSAFNQPSRIAENPRPIHGESIFGRRVETVPRAPEPPSRVEPPYGRPAFEERHTAYGYAERERHERQEREAAMQREREEAIRREREQRDRVEHDHAMQREYAHQLAQRSSQNYSRPPEPREQPAWMRQNHEPPRPPPYERPPYEQASERPPPPQVTNGYDYPTTTAPQYGGPTAYAPPEPRPVDHRYGAPPHPTSVPPQHNIPLAAHYEANVERERLAEAQRRQQQQPMYGGPNPVFQQHESPQRRPVEESQMQGQRGLLSVHEINRRGRASPLPQAVQGAQHQINGPGGEPSIKNEFGRMFSGIGSGVGSMGMPSPVSSGVQGLPFSNSGQARREDLESLQDSPIESGGHQLARTSSRGGRRRKLKAEDTKGDDESSNGRLTPSGRGKRAKTHHHRPHHHHHHRADQMDRTSSPSQSNLTPFKSVSGSNIPSPPGQERKENPNLHHHHVPRPHVHHHVTPPKPLNPIIPIPKVTINNQAVLDSVSNRPRDHLGHAFYRSTLSASSSVKRDRMSDRGFASTPHPLPRFEGKENSTFTVKIPAIYLGDKSREEITSRRAVWGSDIYTDDSDIIAACIHQGWFRGAWNPDVDVSLLDLDIEVEGNGAVQPPLDPDALITSPPRTGPMHVPKNHDCHVTILILPLLQKYSSLTRFGLKSREWGVKHDGHKSIHNGLSFMIMSVRWVKSVDGDEDLTVKGRVSIFGTQLNEEELEEEKAFTKFFYQGNGPIRQSDTSAWFKESYERGPARMGIGTGNWMKRKKETSKGKENEDPAPEPIEAPAPTPAPRYTPIPAPSISASIIPRTSTPPRPMIPLSFSPPTPEPLSPIAPKQAAPETTPVVESVRSTPPATHISDQDTTDRERQIEKVTERMIENANTASLTMVAPSTDPIVDALATLVNVAAEQQHQQVPAAPTQQAEIKHETSNVDPSLPNDSDTPMSG